MGQFLEALRKRVTGVLLGFRAFTLTLATRPKPVARKPIPVDGRSSARIGSTGSTYADVPESTTVEPTRLAESLLSDSVEVSAPRSEPADATQNVSPTESEQQETIQLEIPIGASTRQADDVAAAVIDLEQASPDDEGITCGERPMQGTDGHAFPKPQPVPEVGEFQSEPIGGSDGKGTAAAHIEPGLSAPPLVPPADGIETGEVGGGEVQPVTDVVPPLAQLETPPSAAKSEPLRSECPTTGAGPDGTQFQNS